MSAAENLARWRGVGERGPLPPEPYAVCLAGRTTGCGGIHDAYGRHTADLSREAMPALLAFAEAVLRWADDHVEGYVNVDEVDRLAEQHLGGAR